MMTDVITADLCDNQHRFFYFKDDRQRCPYCKIERLTDRNEKLEAILEAADKLLRTDNPVTHELLALLADRVLCLGQAVEDAHNA